MKVVFFGTPEYAVPSLQAIIDSNHEVLAVVSQPDKPKGRSNKLVPTPVKELAMKYNIPVFQFEKIRKDDISDLLALDADIYVTCAYGQILDEKVLYATKHGVINLHGSILPKYRGSSPVQWALINGETETGVTVLRSDIGMDDGQTLIPSFRTIDGLGDVVANNIVEERKKKEFLSIEDLQNRCKVSQTLIEKMKSMKMLDGMPESSQLSLF